jgi:arginine/lysine/ornithine decarboxylase
MSAQEIEDDLLPDDLRPEPKGAAVPLKRTKKQAARALKSARDAEIQSSAARLAQIVNLHIGGYSLAQIGATIGASAEEVDRLLSQDTARYIRSQPALRTYVRNWVSERYMKMIEADYDKAIDPAANDRLENQDRVMRMLDRMAKLHGAEAPTQSEVKVEAGTETVDNLVARIAASQGMGYDTAIFDTVPGEVVHQASADAAEATRVSGNQLEAPQDGDPDDGF